MRRTAVAVLLGGLLAVSAGPASAQRVVLTDDTGDVWSPDGPPGRWSAEGSVANTDVRATSVAHRVHRLVITSTYADLGDAASDEISWTGNLRTDGEHRRYQIRVSVDWRGESASSGLWRWGAGDWVRAVCDPGAPVTLRYPEDTLQVRVPTECLGHPRWVRFQGLAESYTESDGLFRDPVAESGPNLREWTRKVRHG